MSKQKEMQITETAPPRHRPIAPALVRAAMWPLSVFWLFLAVTIANGPIQGHFHEFASSIKLLMVSHLISACFGNRPSSILRWLALVNLTADIALLGLMISGPGLLPESNTAFSLTYLFDETHRPYVFVLAVFVFLLSIVFIYLTHPAVMKQFEGEEVKNACN